MDIRKGHPDKAVVVDLDGTLLHYEPESYIIKGRSRDCYLSGKTVELLAEISQRLPTFIATGRNAFSVEKITNQLTKVHFAGFVLENGFIVKTDISSTNQHKRKWRFADKVPVDWEPILGYESSVGFILPNRYENPAALVQQLLKETQENGYVCHQHPKIFIYPQMPDKMLGLAQFNVEPYISLGNDLNDMQLLQKSTHSVTLSTACPEIQEIVKGKNGYCSPFTAHAAAEDMLRWAYAKLADHHS
ncbi:MAG: Hydroxymethylpyrimidine pyrophosphatase [Candidatus Electronema aureum]|uniref:Hydroxymethylpyrimidine pyrophosphatase n=1 Tax=Candidatus Electronema aureum TaxID=2005002 RepID=A0A521G2T6_9BACT|nr:MAG: Hydroxymethylpyrimidine pyrophosphatase [Candidatus Electronema aureum]